jgi:hypothetical protein
MGILNMNIILFLIFLIVLGISLFFIIIFSIFIYYEKKHIICGEDELANSPCAKFPFE